MSYYSTDDTQVLEMKLCILRDLVNMWENYSSSDFDKSLKTGIEIWVLLQMEWLIIMFGVFTSNLTWYFDHIFSVSLEWGRAENKQN